MFLVVSGPLENHQNCFEPDAAPGCCYRYRAHAKIRNLGEVDPERYVKNSASGFWAIAKRDWMGHGLVLGMSDITTELASIPQSYAVHLQVFVRVCTFLGCLVTGLTGLGRIWAC